MNDNVKRVLKGFAGLSTSERSELISEIQKYRAMGQYDRDKYERSVKAFSVGPKNTICDCCGR